MIIFVLNPRDQRHSCKQPIADRFPRNFTSAWFSPGRPLWLRRITALSCRFNARLLTGRGVGFPQPVMAIHAVLPHYLFSKRNRPLVPFGTADGKYLLTDLFFCQGTIRLPERTEDGEKEFLFSRLYRVRSLHFEPDYFLKSGNFLNFRMIASLRLLIVFCGRPVTLAYSRSVSPS